MHEIGQNSVIVVAWFAFLGIKSQSRSSCGDVVADDKSCRVVRPLSDAVLDGINLHKLADLRYEVVASKFRMIDPNIKISVSTRCLGLGNSSPILDTVFVDYISVYFDGYSKDNHGHESDWVNLVEKKYSSMFTSFPGGPGLLGFMSVEKVPKMFD